MYFNKNKKAWEPLNIYFINKLQFERKCFWNVSSFDWNKKSHWLCVSMSKLPRDFDFFDHICPNTTIEFCIFKLFLAPNFSLNWKFWFFGPHLTKKGISNRKQKSEHHHWILHIWISLSTKFHFKLTVLIFWTKFALKGYFQSKMEEVNIAIEFCIFELV